MDSGQYVLPKNSMELLENLGEAALLQYGFRNASLELLKDRYTKSGVAKRQIFRVSSPGIGDFVLRVYRPSRTGLDSLLSSEIALQSKLFWLSALTRDTDLSVPKPLFTNSGSPTGKIEVDGFDRPRVCVALSWMPGEVKTQETLRAEDLSLLGSYMARLHRHAETFSAPESFVRPEWNWGKVFDDRGMLWKHGPNFYSEREMKILYDTAQKVRWDLEKLGKGRDVFGLIHRDLNLTNLAFQHESVSAIDFDSCGWGYYFYDLALWLYFLDFLGIRQGSAVAPLRDAFLESYKAERNIPVAHAKYIETFTVMRKVSRINSIVSKQITSVTPYELEFLIKVVKDFKDFLNSKRRRWKLFMKRPESVRYGTRSADSV